VYRYPDWFRDAKFGCGRIRARSAFRSRAIARDLAPGTNDVLLRSNLHAPPRLVFRIPARAHRPRWNLSTSSVGGLRQQRGDLLHSSMEGCPEGPDAAPYGATPRSVAGDIPFTTKGDSLYAIALAWPEDRKLVIKSLASGSPQYRGEITRVGLLGSELNLVWSRTAEGLTVNLPEKPPCDYAYVLKINPSGA